MPVGVPLYTASSWRVPSPGEVGSVWSGDGSVVSLSVPHEEARLHRYVNSDSEGDIAPDIVRA